MARRHVFVLALSMLVSGSAFPACPQDFINSEMEKIEAWLAGMKVSNEERVSELRGVQKSLRERVAFMTSQTGESVWMSNRANLEIEQVRARKIRDLEAKARWLQIKMAAEEGKGGEANRELLARMEAEKSQIGKEYASIGLDKTKRMISVKTYSEKSNEEIKSERDKLAGVDRALAAQEAWWREVWGKYTMAKDELDRRCR